MKIEHFAYQVEDPVATAEWYCEHLGFTIKKAGTTASHTHFLADSSDQVMIEIYGHPHVDVPDYLNMDPLLLHLAFSCDQVPEKIDALTTAGATVVSGPVITGAGDELAMLRDPWGMAIQLCNRATPMVAL